jgi:uncharacterized protein (UPF0335 family)
MTVAKMQLKSIVERIERLEEERKTLASDIREVLSEAKANGFDTKIIKKIVAMRKKEASEREEEQAMTEVYMAALGMLPLFDAAEAPLTVAEELREDTISVTITTTEPVAAISAAEGAGASAHAVQDSPAQSIPHDPQTGEIIETPDEMPSSSGQDGEAVPPLPSASPSVHLVDTCGTVSPSVVPPDITLPDFLRRVPKQEAVA